MLGAGGYDVIEARPGDARRWGVGDDVPDHDTAVIDLDDVTLSEAVIRQILQTRPDSHVVVIAGLSPDWREPHLPEPTTLLEPPLTRERLLAAIETTLRSPSRAAQETPTESPLAPQVAFTQVPVQTPPPVHDAVRTLRTSLHDLSSVREVATVVAEAAAERVVAERIAIVLPDGPVWRVAGGVGLRAVEERLMVEPQHWLITDVLAGHRGAVIEHTDITRAQLRGSPLASMDQLMVATSQSLRAVVIAGRDDPAFGVLDLAGLRAVLVEAEPALEEAMAVRNLARDLAPFADA
jgi:hypothetical protein